MKDLFKTMPEFVHTHDLKHCVVNGREMYCTDERINDEDMPQGLYKAEVRSSDSDNDKWSTIEPRVWVNHCATLVSDKPFEFDKEEIVHGKKFQYTDIAAYDIEY